MLAQSAQLFLILILLMNALAFFGMIVLCKFKDYFQNKSLFLFSALTIGVVFPVIITSLFFTGLYTINLVLTVLVVYFLYKKRLVYKALHNKIQYNVINKSEILKLFIELNGVVVFIFLFYCVLYSSAHSSYFGMPGADTYFYSRVSGNLLNYHTETNAFNFTGYSSPAPYHYFDIWLNSFVSLFNKNNLTSHVFITIPVLSTICYFGFKTLISQFITNKYGVIALAFFGLVLSGVYINGFYDSNFIMSTSNVFSRNLVNYQKLLPLYIFLTWVFYFLMRNEIRNVFIAISAICVCYISSVVAVSIFSFLFLLYCLITRKRKIAEGPMITMGTILLILCFYYFSADKTEVKLSQVQDLDALLNITKLKTGINIFIKTNLQFLALYFYLILIFILSCKNNIALIHKNKYQFFFVLLLYFSALVSWSLFCHVIDSVQLFSNLAIPLLNLASLLFICYNLKKAKSSVNRLLILALILFVAFISTIFTVKEINPTHNFNENSLNEFRKTIYPKLTTKRLVYLKPTESMNTIFTKNDNFAIAAPHLLLVENFEYVSLSVFDYQLSNDKAEAEADLSNLKASVFYKYVKKKRSNDLEKLKMDFVIENDIHLIVLSDGATLPSGIHSLVTDSVIDATAKEKYYLLK